MDKGSKERSPPHNLGRNRVNTYAVRITMLIADIEEDIMDPVMQCTTIPSHSGFSQQKLVSFVTEIHMLLIDFLHLIVRRSYELRAKPCQGDFELPDHSLFPIHIKMEMEILILAAFRIHYHMLHAQTTRYTKASRFKNHESSRIKDKDFRTNSDIQDLPSKISSLSREIVSKLSR
ncbi:hypothetical protein Tco_1231400 [Tanacetum coccineum]